MNENFKYLKELSYEELYERMMELENVYIPDSNDDLDMRACFVEELHIVRALMTEMEEPLVFDENTPEELFEVHFGMSKEHYLSL
jgi:hypothetical protein